MGKKHNTYFRSCLHKNTDWGKKSLRAVTLLRPHHCVTGEMQPGCGGGGSCLPRPLIAWWLVQSYRGIEGHWLTDYPESMSGFYVNVAAIMWGYGVTSLSCLFSSNLLFFPMTKTDAHSYYPRQLWDSFHSYELLMSLHTKKVFFCFVLGFITCK